MEVRQRARNGNEATKFCIHLDNASNLPWTFCKSVISIVPRKEKDTETLCVHSTTRPSTTSVDSQSFFTTLMNLHPYLYQFLRLRQDSGRRIDRRGLRHLVGLSPKTRLLRTEDFYTPWLVHRCTFNYLLVSPFTPHNCCISHSIKTYHLYLQNHKRALRTESLHSNKTDSWTSSIAILKRRCSQIDPHKVLREVMDFGHLRKLIRSTIRNRLSQICEEGVALCGIVTEKVIN